MLTISTTGSTTGPSGIPIATPPSADLPADRHGKPLDLGSALALLEPMEAPERLRWALETFGGRFALTTSFGIQSAVLLHMVSQLGEQVGGAGIPVIWVDTGYLPPETYIYAEELTQRLAINLHVAQAEMSAARMEALHGRLWETGKVKDLQLYNRIRKVDPLDHALRDLDVRCWASGVRRGQTNHRQAMQPLDLVRGDWSLRPLLSWTNRDVYYYIERHELPQHPLFEQGYTTVGDWHGSAPDDGVNPARATRFGGLQEECGIHLPGLLGEGI